MSIKDLWVALYFVFSLQFLRMALLWTFSILLSHYQLLKNSIFSQKLKSYPRCPTSTIPHRPVCVITGATSGLGLAAARDLSKEGYVVVIVGRSQQLLLETIRKIKDRNQDAHLKGFQVDMSSIESIIKFKTSLWQWLLDSDLHCSVQILINNAGILATSPRVTTEGYDQMMGTNYIGAFALTKLLLPLLGSSPVSSKIVNVTSFTHRNDPGVVQTNIMQEVPASLSCLAYFALRHLRVLQSPECGASSIIDAALAPPGTSGVYFFGGKGRTLNPSALSRNSKLALQLWETTCNMLSQTGFGVEEKKM